MLIIGSVLLHAVKGARRELLIEVVRDPTSGSTRKILTKQGSAGSFSQPKVFGAYTWVAMNDLLNAKLAKGYEIATVNGKPFISGDVDDAQLLIENGNNWEAIKTSQPTPKLKAREVKVTFDVGQLAPIW